MDHTTRHITPCSVSGLPGPPRLDALMKVFSRWMEEMLISASDSLVFNTPALTGQPFRPVLVRIQAVDLGDEGPYPPTTTMISRLAIITTSIRPSTISMIWVSVMLEASATRWISSTRNL